MKLARITCALVVGLIAGCGDEKHDHQDHEDHGAPGKVQEDPFADLGAEDAALAKAQKTCPVSDEELGAMGTPVKVVVKGRTVFLCCEGCRKKILNDPDTYLAKLGK